VRLERTHEAEARAADAKLGRAHTAVQAANAELEAFSYSVAHDLRSPLRSIDGFSQALIEDHADQLDAEGRQMLDRVRRAAQRLGMLIDDLLQFSRMNRGELHYGRVDLGAVAASVVAELREAEPSRQVEVVVAPDLMVEGDPQLLRVVLVNLLGNAWKFTGQAARPRVELGTSGERSFFVRDNGVGFDMQYANKLFGPFQRLHGANEFPGTGIGLATVQRIVSRHGGRVWAEAAVGQGATFYFRL
jgi:signal transduction histidine kinase